MRSMAAATGMSQTAVSRISRAFALKPDQTGFSSCRRSTRLMLETLLSV